MLFRKYQSFTAALIKLFMQSLYEQFVAINYSFEVKTIEVLYIYKAFSNIPLIAWVTHV